MRVMVLAAALLLGSGVAYAQVVSPLGGSTNNPQGPPPASRVAPRSPATAAPAAPATSVAPANPTTVSPPGSAATAAAPHRTRRTLEERFTAANTTHDGKLTLEQARAGRLVAVARDFDQIDTGKRGYVTLEEIKAHQTAQRAARRAARRAAPATPAATTTH